MPDLDLAALKALAEKATKGPWECVIEERYVGFLRARVKPIGAHLPTCRNCEGVWFQSHNDAAFIAACDPDTILALIALVEHYRCSEDIYQSRIRQLEPLEAEIESLRKLRRCATCLYHHDRYDEMEDGRVIDDGCVCAMRNPAHRAGEDGCEQWEPKE